MNDMEATILEYVRRKGGGVSFAELQDIEGFKGEMAMCLDAYPSIVLWPFVLEAGAVALRSLLDTHLDWRGCSPLVYFIDGSVPCSKPYQQMPIAKSMRHYKKDHWLPGTFSLKKKSR